MISDQRFLFAVELIAPAGGFGRTLDRINAFHRVRKIPQAATLGHREGAYAIAVWRFANAETAKAFAAQFGGTIIAPPPIGLQQLTPR
jgi:hypothetical protein